MKYNATRSFPPAWVSPKHPNPTHDNGLLIIIDEGEHCGKLVRQIHHQYVDAGQAVLILVVWDVFNDMVGYTSPWAEWLEFHASSLCISVESPEQRKAADVQLAQVREEARQVRAK